MVRSFTFQHSIFSSVANNSVVLVGILVTWFSSRGHFMFLDGVVRNRGSVVEPWRESRREGNSFFLFRPCLGLIALAVVLLILALCSAIAWPAIQGEGLRGGILGAILLAVVFIRSLRSGDEFAQVANHPIHAPEADL